mmetsp:Transcript_15076/g.16777  ORF Transcript_15076/g.16777 Transcript_15076/m.16777 type:complete len:89 (+) Transcript_15076:43-309(+)
MSTKARTQTFPPGPTKGGGDTMMFQFKINRQCPVYFCAKGWRKRNPSWEFRNTSCDANLLRRWYNAQQNQDASEGRMDVGFLLLRQRH